MSQGLQPDCKTVSVSL